MTDAQTERLLSLLERIAKALELSRGVAPVPLPLPTTPSTIGGYQCSRCGTWVLAGATHACIRYDGINTGRPNEMTTVSSPCCPFITAANMRCVRELGHNGAHDIGLGLTG